MSLTMYYCIFAVNPRCTENLSAW